MEMKECNSLDDVRDEIDKVDQQIIALIAQRKDLVKQAANFKNTVEEIKADERVDDVLNKVRHQALTLSLSPNLVAEIYQRMIDDMVETEIAQFRNTKTF
ncbi:MAG: chorismate mutase [Epsilonproteobacteria bacterium]|nr:chorismate mutase [Campylobacterota bacterium]